MLTGLAGRPAETGVREVAGTHAGPAPEALGPWAARVPGLRAAVADELPRGWERGVRARLPLLDMTAYLSYLHRRLAAAGGTVAVRPVPSLPRAAASADAVVNCAGLGARDLVPDPAVHPVRGQIVVVENVGVDEWFTAVDGGRADTVYVLPQPYGVVLGGTAQEHVWDRTPSPCTAQAIIGRCSRVFPRLAHARVLSHRVGLRPARARVRLEAEALPEGGRVVHNYGHGGAGITLSWGCALEAADLVEA